MAHMTLYDSSKIFRLVSQKCCLHFEKPNLVASPNGGPEYRPPNTLSRIVQTAQEKVSVVLAKPSHYKPYSSIFFSSSPL